jgi:hypothetical protein
MAHKKRKIFQNSRKKSKKSRVKSRDFFFFQNPEKYRKSHIDRINVFQEKIMQ